MIRAALTAIFRIVMRLYFRRVEGLGPPPAADTRGRIFCANHGNALIDPIVVLTEAPCPIAPIAKATLWNLPGLGWLLDAAGAVPIVRRKDEPGKDAAANAGTFARIARHLAGGGNVLIFPEGVSHSGPHLVPLRTGAARMLLAAEAEGGVTPTFQAVALEFDAADTFRSRALVSWGPIRSLPAADDDGDEARVQAITAQIDDDLGALLIEADTAERRRLIGRVAEMLANDAGDDSLAAWSTIGRQVQLASELLAERGDPAVAEAEAAVTAYHDALARHRVRDVQLARGRCPAPSVKPARWLRRIALAPLALIGVILYGLPYRLPRRVARSTERDAVSTIKLGVGLAVFPLWAIALTVIAVIFAPAAWMAALAIAVIWLSPLAALRWLDWRDLRDRDLAPATCDALAAARAKASAAVDRARDRLAGALGPGTLPAPPSR